MAFILTSMDWQTRLMPLLPGVAEQSFEVPGDGGDYRLEWRAADGSVKDSHEAAVTSAEIYVFAPAFAEVGETLNVEWAGPAFEGDRLFLYREEDDAYLVETKLVSGQPALMTMDVTPGVYEVLYWYDAYKSIMTRSYISIE